MSRRRVPVRRKIAAATWRAPRDGRIYARMEVDATATLVYLERLRERSGERVTVTHVVGAALGRAIRQVPEIRARVVAGRIVDLEHCDIGFAVDIEQGSDLAPVKVQDVDTLSPLELARAVDAGARRLRRGEDEAYRRSSTIVRFLPTWVMRPLMSTASLLAGGLGWRAFGQPGFPLGAAFVSNVGSLGLDEAFLAPLPFARTPVYLAIGAVQERAVVVDGAVVPRPVLVLVATADHRVVDGAHAGAMATIIRDLLADPRRLEHPLADGAGAASERPTPGPARGTPEAG